MCSSCAGGRGGREGWNGWTGGECHASSAKLAVVSIVLPIARRPTTSTCSDRGRGIERPKFGRCARTASSWRVLLALGFIRPEATPGEIPVGGHLGRPAGRLYYLKWNKVAIARRSNCSAERTPDLGSWNAMAVDKPIHVVFSYLDPLQTIHGDCGWERRKGFYRAIFSLMSVVCALISSQERDERSS